MHRAFKLAAIGVLTGLATPTLATHNHPNFTVPATIPLVRAFAHCSTPSLLHNPAFALPACNPVVTLSAFKIAVPGRFGWVKYMAIAGPDLRIIVKIKTVLDASNNLFNGILNLTFGTRLTDHDCSGIVCTVVDFPLTVPVPCVAGDCFTNTTVNNLVPGAFVGLAERNWEFGPMQVLDPSGALYMTQGAFVP